MNTPAEANTGRQRAASHSSSGNSMATGNFQGAGGRETKIPVIAATAASAATPSKNSRRGGGSRTTEASPITSGATVRMPRRSDANQTCQTLKNGAVEGPKMPIAHAAPTAAVAVATPAATKNPSTRGRLSILKAGPNQRSINHVNKTTSP